VLVFVAALLRWVFSISAMTAKLAVGHWCHYDQRFELISQAASRPSYRPFVCYSYNVAGIPRGKHDDNFHFDSVPRFPRRKA